MIRLFPTPLGEIEESPHDQGSQGDCTIATRWSLRWGAIIRHFQGSALSTQLRISEDALDRARNSLPAR